MPLWPACGGLPREQRDTEINRDELPGRQRWDITGSWLAGWLVALALTLPYALPPSRPSLILFVASNHGHTRSHLIMHITLHPAPTWSIMVTPSHTWSHPVTLADKVNGSVASLRSTGSSYKPQLSGPYMLRGMGPCGPCMLRGMWALHAEIYVGHA